MSHRYSFDSVARLAGAGDNVAIATRRLEQGSVIDGPAGSLTLSHPVLEGHRFAVQAIAEGEALDSWGLPFGVATRDIAPGEYVCNRSMLEALSLRQLELTLPVEPNFADRTEPYRLDTHPVKPAEQVARYPQPRTFSGYRRSDSRGVGTRNHLVLLATSSRTNAHVKQLEARSSHLVERYPKLDGIVAVTHTEGGSETQPNNLELVLRTLAGFMVHPNVGAVLALDDGLGPVTNEQLRSYMEVQGYPLGDVPHAFLRATAGFADSLGRGEESIKRLLEPAARTPRSDASLAHLKIALQCGGSDAFSGISGNPLAAWVAREVIRYGGSANLAETDELIGAEAYMLQNVKDEATAKRFLDTIEAFKEKAAWHGSSAEGNPSGGNKLRGLYNIALKSIGAAMKRHPEVRLDEVIAYAERMDRPGYYFMDSPGNDLESIAGQVASGCNVIFFITGNGSITNFPFVPTLKFVTTSARYRMLEHEMDVNAGAYLDGSSMDALGAETFESTLEIASGQRSAGERAGHSQVQIWRDWPQTNATQLEPTLQQPPPKGESLPIRTERTSHPWRFRAITDGERYSSDSVGLILPTSLCSGQIARLIAERLNQRGLGRDKGVSRFLALIHTEGCGVSSGPSEELYVRTLLGYVQHPLVRHCLLLEHGCEKTHNDYMRAQLHKLGVDTRALGWASIQLDGGIQGVGEKVEAWFASALEQSDPPRHGEVGLEHLRLGLVGTASPAPDVSRSLARLSAIVVGAGGTVVVPENAALLQSADYLEPLELPHPEPTLAYGQSIQSPGFHIMEAPTQHWVETLSGLGATGVEMMLGYVADLPRQAHPMIPLIQVGLEGASEADLDVLLGGDPDTWVTRLLERITSVASKRYTPKLFALGNTDFQMTRGSLGVSL